jgi:hypothetical protein
VTASLPGPLTDALVAYAMGHGSVSLVLVDAASFAPRPGPRSVFRGLPRLQATGAPVVVLRRGDDLAAKLGARAPAREAVHA